jgi:hypothetical protein
MMKITNKRLQQIIKEELNEMMGGMPPLDHSPSMPSLDDIPAGDMDEQELRSAVSRALRSLGLQRVMQIVNEEVQAPPMMESKK